MRDLWSDLSPLQCNDLLTQVSGFANRGASKGMLFITSAICTASCPALSTVGVPEDRCRDYFVKWGLRLEVGSTLVRAGSERDLNVIGPFDLQGRAISARQS